MALCAAAHLHRGVQRGGFGTSAFRPVRATASLPGISGAAIAIQSGVGGINGAEWVKVIYGLVLSLALGLCHRLGHLPGRSTVLCPEHGPAQGGPVLRGRPDRRRRGHELHARGPGRPEIHRRAVPWASPSATARVRVSGMEIPVWLMLLCSMVMGLGHQRGRREDHQVRGHGHGEAGALPGLFCRPGSGASACCSPALFGIPVSTTHTKTSAIMGVGAVKRLSAINFSVVKDMMLTWIFTFPGCGIISFVMAKIFMAVF